MTLDQSYLGFTDKKAPMQRVKAEVALDKPIRFEGAVYSKKDFIFRLLLSGHKPKEELNSGRFNLRTYEKLESKMEYRMQRDGENSYYSVTKTEFDFACYLVGQDLVSEESAARFMDEERERLAREKQERDARHERELEEKLAAQREKKEFSIWFKEQVASYSNQERMDLMDTVFLNLTGVSNGPTELLVLIENIDIPMCRDDLISRLHLGNKASRKTFECVTGLKLPKTARDTRDFLSSVSAADYKDSVPFKMRRSSSKTPTESFYILTRDGFTEVLGEPLVKYGLTWFIHQAYGQYRISEARSGIMGASGKNRQEALDELKNVVGRQTAEGIEKSVQDSIVRRGISPRYREAEGRKTEGAA